VIASNVLRGYLDHSSAGLQNGTAGARTLRGIHGVQDDQGEISLASYVETIVGPGEEVLYVGKVSLLSILPSLIGGTILMLVGGVSALFTGGVGLLIALPGLAWIAAGLIRRSSTELAVTNRRVIAKFGLIKRSTVELNLSKVESIRVEQSVMGRIFGYGSIVVTGTGSTMEPIPYISDPIRFRQAVQAGTDSAQKALTT
jgi:hypothetical protein